jgi:hypothetical protein
MTPILRRLRGTIGIGLLWGTAWATLLVTIGLIIGVLDPASIDPGEESLPVAWIGLRFGFMSGVAFAIILSLAEGRRTLGELSLWRVTLWGVLGAAAFPLLTPMNDAPAADRLSPWGRLRGGMRRDCMDGRTPRFEVPDRDRPNRCRTTGTTPRAWLAPADQGRMLWPGFGKDQCRQSDSGVRAAERICRD